MLDKLTTPPTGPAPRPTLAARLVSRTGMGFDVHAFAGDGPADDGRDRDRPRPRPRRAQRCRCRASRHHRRLARRRRARRHRRAFPAVRPAMERRRLGDLPRPCRAADPRRGGIIDFVDCTVIAEAPKVGPHRAAMRSKVAEILALAEAPGQHQGDDDRAARLHRPRRRHCRPGGGDDPHGDRAMSDYLLPAELVDKAREVVEANRAAGRRVAVAESCTGGLVSAALTEIAGSSEMFEAGFVTYSNAAKIGRAARRRRRRRDLRRGQHRHRLGDGAGRARGVGRRRRGGDHRHRRTRRRDARRSRSARWCSPAPSAAPSRTRSSPTRNCSMPSGGRSACGFRRRSARSTC